MRRRDPLRLPPSYSDEDRVEELEVDLEEVEQGRGIYVLLVGMFGMFFIAAALSTGDD